MSIKDDARKLREMLEQYDPEGLRVIYHEEKEIIRIEITSIKRLPAPVMMAGTVSHSDGKLVVVVPLKKLKSLVSTAQATRRKFQHTPGKYGTRQIDIGGEVVDTEYVSLEMVGIPYDGAFRLDNISEGGKKKRVAGTVAFTEGEF